MKRLQLKLAMAIALLSTGTHIYPAKRGIIGVVSKYTVSLASGAVIGASVGVPCACVDMMTFPIGGPIISWPISYKIRHAITDSVHETLDEEEVRHCNYVLNTTAWVSSWASWLVTLGMLHK